MNIVSPKNSERFFLKLILNHTKGSTSFENMRTFKNILYSTYKDAVGLVEDDSTIFNMFDEACAVMLPFQLRKFFAWFLLSENIQGDIIWNKYKIYFAEDFKENKENNALIVINNILSMEDMSCKDFGLPEPNLDLVHTENQNNQATLLYCQTMFNHMYNQLNVDQKLIFEKLINNSHKIHFIDGPGGSGKTFLYKTLIYYFLSIEKNIISMAWIGIASILLPKGMTSHRTFRLPLDLNSIETAFLKLESDKKKLREVDLIIWDEASMIPKKALEIVDRTLRDVCTNDTLFGGKLIVLGGDFRQILPVLKNGFRSAIVEDIIKNS